MKNDTVFVRMRSGDHLGYAKCWKRHLASSSLTFWRIAIDSNGFRRKEEEGEIYKTLPQIFLIFAPGLSIKRFQSLVIILPSFFNFHFI